MGVVHAYCDESGKFKDHKVVSFGGIVGPHATMETFDRHWRRCLRQVKLTSLTMKTAVREQVALSERIPAQSVRERIKVLEPFAACIRDYVDLVVVIALDVDGYARIRKRTKKLVADDNPHMIAFAGMLYKLIDWLGPNDSLSLICDDEEEMALPCYRFYRRCKRLNVDARQKLACLSFADDEVFLPLQGADMLATIVRLEARRRFFQEPSDYSSLYKFIGSPRLEASFLNDVAIVELGERMQRRKLASAFGLPS